MKIPRSFLPSLLFIAALLALVPLVRRPGPRQVTPHTADLKPLSLEGHRRLLVLAPHSDDESLGSAGLIQAARSAGIEVRVVIATNGDGFIFATMEDFRRVYPRHQDFIRMGNLRQQESLAALGELGVPANEVIFLSYPDRGTPALWNDHWSESNPYRSPFSGETHSPYTLTYNPKSVYAGEDFLADLRSILDSYLPDLIVYSHPQDVHPDHWGLAAFSRLALALEEQANPGYQPDAYAYLVHRPDFPASKGLLPDASLLPPQALFDLDPAWLRLDLDPQEESLKNKAIDRYRSQHPLLHTLLDSFVRRNELFVQTETADLPTIAEGDPKNPDTWRSSTGQPVQPVQLDPTKDYLTREVVASADLVSVYAARQPDGSLALCSQVRGRTESPLFYTLRVMAVGQGQLLHVTGRNWNLSPGWKKVTLSGRFACLQVSMAELGNPWLLFAGANVAEEGVGILDQAAWQMIYVR